MNKHKQSEESEIKMEDIFNSFFSDKINSDSECKACGGKGIQQTKKTVLGEMVTTVPCPSCKVEKGFGKSQFNENATHFSNNRFDENAMQKKYKFRRRLMILAIVMAVIIIVPIAVFFVWAVYEEITNPQQPTVVTNRDELYRRDLHVMFHSDLEVIGYIYERSLTSPIPLRITHHIYKGQLGGAPVFVVVNFPPSNRQRPDAMENATIAGRTRAFGNYAPMRSFVQRMVNDGTTTWDEFREEFTPYFIYEFSRLFIEHNSHEAGPEE